MISCKHRVRSCSIRLTQLNVKLPGSFPSGYVAVCSPMDLAWRWTCTTCSVGTVWSENWNWKTEKRFIRPGTDTQPGIADNGCFGLYFVRLTSCFYCVTFNSGDGIRFSMSSNWIDKKMSILCYASVFVHGLGFMLHCLLSSGVNGYALVVYPKEEFTAVIHHP